MDNFDKLYTVEDIAQMTMLTTRTIRNYLKDGLLIGRKVGGQWRFTAKDIEGLFANSSVAVDINNSRHQDVMDFIDGVNTDIDGDIQICTLVDYYCEDLEIARAISEKISSLISSANSVQKHRFYYEYSAREAKARYTIFGTPHFAVQALAVIEEEWNRINLSLGKFTDRARIYADFRPSYPSDLIDFIYAQTGSTQPLKFADIGSGTGKMSACLLDRGSMVYGVEPNANMRAEAEKQFTGRTGFISINGTGENTTLPTDSVDVIVCAEAYHWFDNDKSKLEFRRILRKDGYTFLTWNEFSSTNPYAADLERLNRELRTEKSKEIAVSRASRAAGLFGTDNFVMHQFDNTIFQSLEALSGGLLSASYAPKAGDTNYEAYVQGIKDIFAKYSLDGRIKTVFDTVCYCGKLR